MKNNLHGGDSPNATSPGPLRVVGAVLRDDRGRVLLAKRPPGGAHGGLWEFPGGKVEPGETQREALARELHEELGVRVRVGGRVGTAEHRSPSAWVSLTVYECRITTGVPRALEHEVVAWVLPGDLGRYPMPEADLPIWNRMGQRG